MTGQSSIVVRVLQQINVRCDRLSADANGIKANAPSISPRFFNFREMNSSARSQISAPPLVPSSQSLEQASYIATTNLMSQMLTASTYACASAQKRVKEDRDEDLEAWAAQGLPTVGRPAVWYTRSRSSAED